MKKLGFFILLIIGFAFHSYGQAKKIKFYYYPSSNVYYNTASNKYVYNNNGKWITVNTLPGTTRIANIQRMTVYNTTPQVWENNREHVAKSKIMKLKSAPSRHVKANAARKVKQAY